MSLRGNVESQLTWQTKSRSQMRLMVAEATNKSFVMVTE